MIDVNTLVTGLLIFIARIADVSLGTVRIIVTVQGRSVMAFFFLHYRDGPGCEQRSAFALFSVERSALGFEAQIRQKKI